VIGADLADPGDGDLAVDEPVVDPEMDDGHLTS
jgi:hypothetical protein